MLVRTGSRTIEVCVVRRRELSDVEAARVRPVDDWVLGRIAAPDPHLGRPGDVCPFVAPALRVDTLRYAIVAGSDLTALEMTSVINSLGVLFDGIRSSSERPNFETIVAVFPEMAPCSLAKLILQVHGVLKDTFIRARRMLGEFMPGYDAPGIHNPDFRPLTAPEPLLVIRSMVANDRVFLTDHPEWIAVHAGYFPEALCRGARLRA